MNCLACGPTSSPPSREHVFSRWLLEEFQGRDVPMGLFKRDTDGNRERKRVDIKLDSFRLKGICEACNNGWMSTLENEAKPLILALIRGVIQFSALSEVQRRVLARWAGKPAIIESHSVGAESPVSSDFLKRMRTNGDGVPGRFAVAASRTHLEVFALMQIGLIFDLIGGGSISGNIVMIVLPKLAFACIFPMLKIPYECRCLTCLYAPLWPSPRAWKAMEITPLPTGLDELETVAAMAERLEMHHSFL
jgi:hypothetical protein